MDRGLVKFVSAIVLIWLVKASSSADDAELSCCPGAEKEKERTKEVKEQQNDKKSVTSVFAEISLRQMDMEQYKGTASLGVSGNETTKVDEFFHREEQAVSSCFLLEEVGSSIPNAETCRCRTETSLDLTCQVEGACSYSVCAETTKVEISLNGVVSIDYCSVFQQETSDLADTCISLTLTTSGESIASCDAVTYGGQRCLCAACLDRSSLNIDCSEYNCRATTNGCQAVDLSGSELVTIVPLFQPRDYDCSAAGEISFDRSQSCDIFVLLAQNIPDAEEFCSCASETAVDCRFFDQCDENGLCADLLNVNIDIAAGLPVVEYCTDFTAEYERTCVEFGVNIDQTISGCSSATYGGKQCSCSICDDAASFIVDCSEFNPGATNGGCQTIPTEIGPLIPAFVPFEVFAPLEDGLIDVGGGNGNSAANGNSVANSNSAANGNSAANSNSAANGNSAANSNSASNTDSAGGSSFVSTVRPTRPPPEGPKDCFMMSMLAGELPNITQHCVCDGQQALNCYMDNVCTEDVCGDEVDLRIDISNGNIAQYCVTYRDPFFEQTCVEVAANFDQTIASCNSVKYGGKDCTCTVCDDRQSLTIDCSKYNPYATNGGCQGLDGLNPTLPLFRSPGGESDGGSVSGIDGNAGVEASCGLINLLRDRIDDADEVCACQTEERVDCMVMGICTAETCAEVVDFSIDVSQGVTVTNCVTFDNDRNRNELAETCFSVEANTDLSPLTCSSATYGGRPCQCILCDGRRGIQIDCTEHEKAAINACQEFNADPFVPDFSAGAGDATRDDPSADSGAVIYPAGVTTGGVFYFIAFISIIIFLL